MAVDRSGRRRARRAHGCGLCQLRTAEDKLTAARAAAARGEHGEAIRQADQALADADYARARASNAQVKKIADDMRQNIQTLRQELERLPR